MFVAVWPDHATRRLIKGLALPPGPDVRLVDPAHWHVTLQFLGDVEEQAVPRLGAALETVAGRVDGPIQCRVGPTTAWLGDTGVLHLPVTGLDRLAQAVRSATLPVRVPPRDHLPFMGHLTLGRSRRRRPTTSPKAGLASIPLSTTFHVTHFDLVTSVPSPTGSRYTPVLHVPIRSGG